MQGLSICICLCLCLCLCLLVSALAFVSVYASSSVGSLPLGLNIAVSVGLRPIRGHRNAPLHPARSAGTPGKQRFAYCPNDVEQHALRRRTPDTGHASCVARKARAEGEAEAQSKILSRRRRQRRRRCTSEHCAKTKPAHMPRLPRRMPRQLARYRICPFLALAPA